MRAFGCMTRAVIQSAQMLAYPSVVSETASMGCLYGSLRVWQVPVTVLCGGIKLCGETDEHAEKYETHQHAPHVCTVHVERDCILYSVKP